MKQLFILLLTHWTFLVGAQSLNDVRKLYLQNPEEEHFEKITKISTNNFNGEDQIIFNAYKGSATMALAQYAFLPTTKMSLFNDGKELMEASIKKQKTVENIYLRLITQLSAPSFLGYNTQIENDIAFLEKNLKNSTIPLFVKTKIIESLNEYNEGRYDLSNLTL